MCKIKTKNVKDDCGCVFYPKTSIDAVFDPKTGKKLTDLLGGGKEITIHLEDVELNNTYNGISASNVSTLYSQIFGHEKPENTTDLIKDLQSLDDRNVKIKVEPFFAYCSTLDDSAWINVDWTYNIVYDYGAGGMMVLVALDPNKGYTEYMKIWVVSTLEW